MNRLVLVPCIVVACCVAVASYIASYVVSYILLQLDRSRIGFKISTFKGGEIYREFSSRIKQASSFHPSYEAPKKPAAIAEKLAAAVLPETSPSHESIYQMKLVILNSSPDRNEMVSVLQRAVSV
jgi:hypothetical protein